jgi:hypothetical protein
MDDPFLAEGLTKREEPAFPDQPKSYQQGDQMSL